MKVGELFAYFGQILGIIGCVWAFMAWFQWPIFMSLVLGVPVGAVLGGLLGALLGSLGRD